MSSHLFLQRWQEFQEKLSESSKNTDSSKKVESSSESSVSDEEQETQPAPAAATEPVPETGSEAKSGTEPECEHVQFIEQSVQATAVVENATVQTEVDVSFGQVVQTDDNWLLELDAEMLKLNKSLVIENAKLKHEVGKYTQQNKTLNETVGYAVADKKKRRKEIDHMCEVQTQNARLSVELETSQDLVKTLNLEVAKWTNETVTLRKKLSSSKVAYGVLVESSTNEASLLKDMASLDNGNIRKALKSRLDLEEYTVSQLDTIINHYKTMDKETALVVLRSVRNLIRPNAKCDKMLADMKKSLNFIDKSLVAAKARFYADEYITEQAKAEEEEKAAKKKKADEEEAEKLKMALTGEHSSSSTDEDTAEPAAGEFVATASTNNQGVGKVIIRRKQPEDKTPNKRERMAAKAAKAAAKRQAEDCIWIDEPTKGQKKSKGKQPNKKKAFKTPEFLPETDSD